MLYAAAYLRAAQAYMLISMPTDTSTIFGAFQAILALLKVKPDAIRPLYKVIQIEKFASGILSGRTPAVVMLHRTIFCGNHGPVPVKPMTHQWVLLSWNASGDGRCISDVTN